MSAVHMFEHPAPATADSCNMVQKKLDEAIETRRRVVGDAEALRSQSKVGLLSERE